MKENSREENIKNAEHFIKSIKTDKEYQEENGWHGYYNKEIVELARMLEHILSDYKRVLEMNEVLLKENELLRKYIESWKKYCEEIEEEQTEMSNKNCELEFEVEKLQKENEKLKADNYELNNRITDLLENIPIQKVKDKIKEEKIPLTIAGGIRNKKILEYGISLGRMQVLQELIEEK